MTTDATAAQPEPESFSPANAREAILEMHHALPKSKQLDYLGNLNEGLVVLDKLVKLAGITDPNKAV
jgi:hypothetical protein